MELDGTGSGTGTAADGSPNTTCFVSTASKTTIVSTCVVTMATQVRIVDEVLKTFKTTMQSAERHFRQLTFTLFFVVLYISHFKAHIYSRDVMLYRKI